MMTAWNLMATVAVLLCMGWWRIASASAATTTVEGTLMVPSGEMAPNYQITLNRGEHSTLSRADGTFAFYEVPPGIYLLDVASVHHYFPQMKIKVAAAATAASSSSGSASSSSSSSSSGSSSSRDGLSVSVVEYKYPGAMRSAAPYPIELVAVLPLTYFQAKPSLSILGMLLGNPMMLIFIVILGVMLMFPNALKEMAESEEFKKASEEQAKQGDPMTAFKQMMGMEAKPATDDD